MKKLNKFGITKITPFVQSISDDLCSDATIHSRDDKVIIDSYPLKLMEEMQSHGMWMICQGGDNDHFYFNVYCEGVISEQPVPAAPGAPAPVAQVGTVMPTPGAKPTEAAVQQAGSPGKTEVAKLGAAAKKRQGDEKESELIAKVREVIMPEIQDMFGQFAKSMQQNVKEIKPK